MQVQETISIIYTHNSRYRKELNSLSGIYKLQINNRFYIGSAASFYNRIYIHLNSLSNNKHYNTFLQNSYNKHGKENLTIEILEFTKRDKVNLISREQYWIDKLNPEFNVCPEAGSTTGRVLSEESKQKIKLSKLGKKRSEEVRKNISLGRLNMELSEDDRQRIRKYWNREFNIKKVTATNIHTKEEILFDSLMECCEKLKVYRSNIYKVLKGQYAHTKGYTFVIHDRIKKESLQ